MRSRSFVMTLLGCALIAQTPIQARKAVNGMSDVRTCKDSPLSQSKCMIELMLDDLEEQYGPVMVGGVSQIKAISTTSYTISVPRHERVQIYLYEFELDATSVRVKSKTESVKSY